MRSIIQCIIVDEALARFRSLVELWHTIFSMTKKHGLDEDKHKKANFKRTCQCKQYVVDV